jgi:hypothetical protein
MARQYYFHPTDFIPVYNEDGEEIATSRVDCMECVENQKNSDIRRIIKQCQDSLELREIARRTILGNAYNRFYINKSYRYKGKIYRDRSQFEKIDDVEYIDRHQYDGFRHTQNNIERCESIITDRITNPYSVFFFYPSNVRINRRIINTSEHKRFFHSSHPTGEEAFDTITRNVSRTTEGTLEAQRIYFIVYFGDNEDDGKLAWNPSIPLLEQ